MADRPLHERWYSTEEAARTIGGVSPRWVRLQIEFDRLPARMLLTGRRPTYRIREADLTVFIGRYVREAGDRAPPQGPPSVAPRSAPERPVTVSTDRDTRVPP